MQRESPSLQHSQGCLILAWASGNHVYAVYFSCLLRKGCRQLTVRFVGWSNKAVPRVGIALSHTGRSGGSHTTFVYPSADHCHKGSWVSVFWDVHMAVIILPYPLRTSAAIASFIKETIYFGMGMWQSLLKYNLCVLLTVVLSDLMHKGNWEGVFWYVQVT